MALRQEDLHLILALVLWLRYKLQVILQTKLIAFGGYTRLGGLGGLLGGKLDGNRIKYLAWYA